MSDNMYDHFDKEVSGLIVHAKAASINAQTDCIYPESFAIGILTTGENDVTTLLMDENIDLESCLKLLKKELSTKKRL